MSRSKIAVASTTEAAIEALLALYEPALSEVLAAIRAAVAGGRRPERSSEAQLSKAANGMASLSDGLFSRTGPLDYPTVLEPPYSDPAARAEGRYPEDRFPAMQALVKAATTHPAFASYPERFADFQVRMQIEAAANAHLAKFDQDAVSETSARSVLLPAIRGLLDNDLDIALVVPIALTRFDFRTVRLGPDVLVVLMSDALQKARYTAKAYGAKGHDSVLAAATHAFVVTRWRIENYGIKLSGSLSTPWENSTAAIDRLFAALRLATGVETGYAQVVRLARGWRTTGRSDEPEVFAAPARSYPDAFDDYGWNREALPLVTRADMKVVGELLSALDELQDSGVALALRRLNAAATRTDPADAILDAVIGLEILLGDKDKESISWKLRMRAAAIVGIEGSRDDMQRTFDDISTLYKERSSIVHGLKRKAGAPSPEDVRRFAVEALRRVLHILLRRPEYLDPLKIDAELLLTSLLPPSSAATGGTPRTS